MGIFHPWEYSKLSVVNKLNWALHKGAAKIPKSAKVGTSVYQVAYKFAIIYTVINGRLHTMVRLNPKNRIINDGIMKDDAMAKIYVAPNAIVPSPCLLFKEL